MRYTALELTRSAAAPVETMLTAAKDLLSGPLNPLANTLPGRIPVAALESVIRLIKPYHKQGYDYGTFEFNGQPVTIQETVAVEKPFGNLLRFERAGGNPGAPKVLFVAAMSGHFATLSKDTFREFLPDHDVYATDWVDAKTVPVSKGRFGFEEYISYLIDFIEHIGSDVHVIGLCQAAVPALCASAIMAKTNHPARPKSLSLLAGPIDIAVNPNKITKYVEYFPMGLVEKLAIQTVPGGHAGKGRRVYPGVLQLGAFASLNLTMHMKKHLKFFKDVALGDDASAQKHRDFYNEYMTVMDAPVEFWDETLKRVFVERLLPKGEMTYRGERVDCSAIRDIALLTLEGEKDDMVALGVTEAAHSLCSSLSDDQREHHVQPGVGHYGIFNGSSYRREVAPKIKAFIQARAD
ncbi:MAG: polyhydroxyalkanoate depolymerase [Rhodopila sp.]|jgi:poly(3-hydroxybutyrate) depolymerase